MAASRECAPRIEIGSSGYAWANGSVVSTSANVDAAVANFGPGSFNLANKIQFTVIPEPSALALLVMGALCLFVRRRNV
jgi:hypothetical protein